MKEVQKAGGIVVNNSGEVLVITNDLGKHTFPKGTPNFDEKLIETARREIQEETGLSEFTIHRKLGILVRPGYSDDNKITPTLIKHIHFFFCTTAQMELSPQTADSLAAEWVKPDLIATVLSWPQEVKFFEQHRDTLNL